MSENLVRIKNLNVAFSTAQGEVSAVRNLSFDIPLGKTIGLVGESGSGKSVTSLSILGLLPSANSRVTGEIDFNGQNLLSLDEEQMRTRRGSQITMIFQEPMTSLNPVFRVGEQVMETLRLHKKLSRQEAQLRTIDLFKEVGIPDPEIKVNSYPHELSGGQRQRVMIAMAIACEPSLLIADEPTTALDVTIQKQILELLAGLQKKYKMSVLFITHDLAVIGDIADEVRVMYKGELVESGKTREVFKNPSHPYTKSLLSCRPSPDLPPRRLATVSDFMTNEGKEKAFDVSTLGLKGPPPPSSETLLEIRELSTHFPIKTGLLRKTTAWVRAVNNVNLSLKKGRTLGLVGESGCGKTTLGRTLMRLIEPTRGQIVFNGQDITHLDEKALRPLRKQMQIIFQDPYSSLNPRMRIEKALMEPMQVHGIGSSASERREMAGHLMEKVGLDPRFLKRYPHEFSGGQRQRVCIARALSVRPSFIVCDESVSALDVSVQAQILNLLLDLKEEMGLTYVFISHDLAVIRFFSDDVAVMEKGEIIELNSAEEVYAHPQQEYTKQLLASIPKGL